MAHNNKSGEIGTATAEAVVKFLRGNGWPAAERTAQHGARDVGDVTGTPGLAWEVKGGKAAEKASDGQVAAWLVETERERLEARAEVGVLVLKRSGIGAVNVARWWAIVPAGQIFGPAQPYVVLRLLLGDLVAILRHEGYGSDPAPQLVAL